MPDWLWTRAVAKAARRGESIGEVVRRLLTLWVERDDD